MKTGEWKHAIYVAFESVYMELLPHYDFGDSIKKQSHGLVPLMKKYDISHENIHKFIFICAFMAHTLIITFISGVSVWQTRIVDIQASCFTAKLLMDVYYIKQRKTAWMQLIWQVVLLSHGLHDWIFLHLRKLNRDPMCVTLWNTWYQSTKIGMSFSDSVYLNSYSCISRVALTYSSFISDVYDLKPWFD